MYSENFQKSLKAVEEARKENIAYEPKRMTAEEKRKTACLLSSRLQKKRI
ncbi:MAG: hypothetical protein L6V93_16935 [Clostridiales bacterium]|nr:MAG: hypothetical protein L6V93_16935 [Clostridiales bacterium]